MIYVIDLLIRSLERVVIEIFEMLLCVAIYNKSNYTIRDSFKISSSVTICKNINIILH